MLRKQLTLVLLCLFTHASHSQPFKLGIARTVMNRNDPQSRIEEGLGMARRDKVQIDPFEVINYVGIYCDGITGMRCGLNMFLENKVQVLIGTNCYENCIPIAQVAAYFNIPYFPLTCVDPTIDNYTTYSTTIRIFGSLTSFGWAFQAFYEEVGWKSTAIIMESASYICKNTIDAVVNRFGERLIQISDFIELTTTVNPDDLEIIKKVKKSARIIIVCHSDDSVLRRIMFLAQELGMTDPVSYVWITFFNIYMDFPFHMLVNPWITGNETSEEEVEKHRQAFICLKIITFKNSTSILYLRDNETAARNLRLDFFTDLVYMYLRLRNTIKLNGGDPKNGKLMFNESKHFQFQGREQYMLFNEYGYRVMPFVVWTLTPSGRSYEQMYELIPTSDNTYKPALIAKPTWGTSLKTPPDIPVCGYSNELCIGEKVLSDVIIIIIAVAAVLLVLGSVLGLLFNRGKDLQVRWIVDINELKPSRENVTKSSRKSVGSLNTLDHNDDSKNVIDILNETGLEVKASYRGVLVTVRCFARCNVKLSKVHLKELNLMKDFRHDNLVPFIGAILENEQLFFVTENCSRGCLQDILEDSDIKIELSFKMSFLCDIAKGMAFLHKSYLSYHGSLTSNACLVTNRWLVKISGFGLSQLKQGNYKELPEDEFYKSQLWTAPEHLRSIVPGEGSQKGDVFSFAILAYEICFRVFPYDTYNLTFKEIISRVKNSGFSILRPSIDSMEKNDVDPMILTLISQCWSENPSNRPSFDEINKKIQKDNVDIIDNILDKLEKYASNLEKLVDERTQNLTDEKKKTDLLLYSLLPPFVADELKSGHKVEPRLYQKATVYFSDIVGFPALSSESTPIEIVNLLNDLYRTMDNVIARHKVYKVETIGDSYMVVSGLPQETSRHVVEICNMALDLLSLVDTFKIRHRPDMKLMLRIGIHTGPCAAGVVGHVMPRYCLFGDTVNTASRMESTGEALKIHLSSQARNELLNFPGFLVELRGPTELKGKGVMITHWLIKRETQPDNDSN